MKTLPHTTALVLVFFLFGICGLPAEPEGSPEVAGRYEQMLVRTPQSGAAFDRVVNWYAATSGLPALQKRWEEAAGQDPSTARSYLILRGLLAQRQGLTAEARKFFQEALAREGEKAQAARPLATLETTEGNFRAAAEAYVAALSSESLPPPDRLELMRSLALLYQRSFDSDKALSVWRDAVEKFPFDPYVLEEAGEAFIAAGSYEDARKSFSRQRELATDPFQKIAASLRIARALELDGKVPAAVALYESALEETSGGSWINREVRGQIEALFRRKDDLPGLLAFYEKRIISAPQDYVSLLAQASVLEDLGRTEEAITCTRAASKLAPDDAPLRLALIRLLAAQNHLEEALEEAATLAKPANASAQALVTLGNLYWTKHEQNHDEASRQAALSTWSRLAPEEAREISRIAQLAEILGSHGLTDEAAAQWQRIVALSPDLPEPRQRLAEFFLKRGDKTAAAQILGGLVAGDLAQPANFITLARIQERLELPDEARLTTQKGLDLFPKNFDLLGLVWRQALEAGDTNTVTRLFPDLWQNAPGDFAAAEAEKKCAAFLEAAGTGRDTARTLLTSLETGAISPAEAALLFRLALAQNDEPNTRKALAAIQKQNNAVRTARAGYDLAQAFGSADEQITALQAIAAADSRLASESLRTAARLQAEAGRPDAALATLSGLIESSPADVSLYTLYADIATRAGKSSDAVAQLNKAIRQVDDTTTLRLQLAGLLDLQGRTGEAAKVLQEAFEQEQAEPRRMEIFRRQVETAMRAGTIEELIATLREKQLREKGGARYGTYLAEIFMAQGDFLAAREELTRSLGRTPDNPAAIARLLDLAERGGDQEECLRLAKKLAELAPSAQNRSAFLTRLFESGESASGLDELGRVRGEILKDPKAWSGALLAMRKTGLSAESDAIVEEIAAASESGILQGAELARLRLMQRNYDAAENALWQVLESGDFAASLAAVAEDVSPTLPGFPQSWMQPFQLLSNEVQNSLQMMFQSSRGYFSSRGFPGGTTRATPEQREQVRSLFLLNLLAGARRHDEAFEKRFQKFLADRNIPRRLRLMSLRCINDTEGAAALVREQAEDAAADIETDRVALTVTTDPALETSLAKIRSRLAAADPKAAFEQALQKASAELNAQQAAGKTPGETEYRKLVDTLMNLPGFAESATGKTQVATYAALAGDYALAFRLCDETSASLAGTSGPANSREAQIAATRASVLAQAIAANDPLAAAEFEKILKAPAPGGGQSSVYYTPYGMGFSRTASPLVQHAADLVAGDTLFPVAAFRRIATFPADSPKAAKVQKWFAGQASANELTPFTIGAFYAEWFAGKREDAVRRIEALQAKSPSPRSAALLLEAYEKLSQPAKALAVADGAAFQPGETADVRSLRTIRLLRAAGKKDEARAAAERLARGRVSLGVREQLANELNALGVPPTAYQNLTAGSMGRMTPQRDSSEPIRLQISKLIAEKKIDEAERIAVQFLQRPLPTRQDYRTINARQNIVSQLASMGRLEILQEALQGRLEKNPADLDAAIRLAEAGFPKDSANATRGLAEFLKAHPRRDPGLEYAFQLLMRSGDSRREAADALCALIRADPESLSASGMEMQELMNFFSQPEAGLVFSDAVAAMDVETFSRFFLTSRLTLDSTENAILSQLAEMSAQAGKTSQAITLLTRNRPEAMKNLYAGLPSLLRLAELQLDQNDMAGAAFTMKSLIEVSSPQIGYYGGGNQTLTQVFFNLLINSQNQGIGMSTILRTARLAERTGTLDKLLSSMADSKNATFGISPALIIRTVLKQPGISDEWRAIALSENPQQGVFSAALLPIALTALADEKDAKKILPALLRKIPDGQFGYGAESSLSILVETLPKLAKYQSDPAVGKFVTKLVAQVLSDPNGSRYLLFSQSYAPGINVLMDHGFTEEARSLFATTAVGRAAGNYGSRAEMENIERRLQAGTNGPAAITVACAAWPADSSRLRIRWKVSEASASGEENDSSPPPTWQEGALTFPKSSRPTELEIFAGPNPGALEKITRIASPDLTGSVEAAATQPLGLVQARWKLPDGSTGEGPLTAYVLGENLILNNAAPDGKNAGGSGSFKTGLPGPAGDSSAVRYDALSPSHQAIVEAGSATLTGKPETLVFSGWVLNEKGRFGGPRLEIRWTHENGKTDTRGTNYFSGASGQWHQIFQIFTLGERLSGGMQLPETVRKINLVFALQATSGYNSQYSVNGTWDGLQLVRLNPPDSSKQASDLLEKFRYSQIKKEFAPAADAYLAAFRLDPALALQQTPATIAEVFQKANRPAELFTQIAAPALFLPNPLKDNQPTLNNPAFIELLLNTALAPGATPVAKSWLARVKNSPLSENLRFVVQAAALREAASRDPSKTDVAEVLATLGFRPDGINANRLRLLWFLEQQGKPTLGLLKLLEEPRKSAEAIAQLQSIPVPVELSVSRQMLEAWLTASADPGKALTLWSQAIAMRYGGNNSVSVEDAANRALLLRIAAGHPQPGTLVAAANTWLAKARPNGQDQQRILVELLYAAAATDSAKSDEYASLWADAELAALKTPGYNASRDRVRELAFRLMETAQWNRLESLLEAAKTSPALANDILKREFAQLRNIAALARGDAGAAWPVVWAKPGTDPREITVAWQWNIKDIAPDRSDFDTAVSVAAKPLLPEISGQQSVEILFGEMPSGMKIIGKVDGTAAQGSLPVSLPSANGFLRAVAVFDDKRILGPLTVVNSGRRVYPPDGTSLKDLLLSGPEPLAPALITESGTAPDGSPALRLGSPQERRRLSFAGPAFPVTPGKFYIERAWVRRTGTGSVSVSSEFTPIKTSKAGSLNMLLTEQMEATGQWVFYTRATPALNQHTFWIPMDDIAAMTPRMWDMDPGTEIAGFELLEIEGWKYADWLTELVLLRKNAGERPDAATLDRAITLASVEPLTAMDYQGDWLGRLLPAAGREVQLLELFRGAFSAEANPLFSRPKLPRIFDYLLGVLNRGEGSAEFRENLALLALDSPARTSPMQRIAFFFHAITLAPTPEKKAELTLAAREELARKLRDESGGKAFLKAALTTRIGRDERPSNELLRLLVTLNDPATSALFLETIQGQPKDGVNLNDPSGTAALSLKNQEKRIDGLESSDQVFATIALEAAMPNATAGATWNEEITRAFRATEKSNSPETCLRWPFVLADFLASRSLAPDVVTALRRQTLQRALAAKPEDAGRTAEAIRAAAFLLENRKGDARETAAAILPIIQAASGKLSEGSLRLLLLAVNRLTESDANEQAAALVRAAEPDIRRFPKMTEDFAKHLPTGSPTP